MMMEWISVNDDLPVIPEGKHAVRVIVATFDSVYDELSGGNGYSVYQVFYGPTKDKKFFNPDSLEFDFYEGYYGYKEFDYGPTGDPVKHWMYFPEPPKIKVNYGNFRK